ncbi:hypothetical protein PTKIN_Ptkin01aG0122400 [Pterospermum kingtungense]
MESTDSSSASQHPQLPPGFRFHPTDEELVVHYLKRKAASAPLPVTIIAEVDLYKFDQWELPSISIHPNLHSTICFPAQANELCEIFEGKATFGRKSGIFLVQETGNIPTVQGLIELQLLVTGKPQGPINRL